MRTETFVLDTRYPDCTLTTYIHDPHAELNIATRRAIIVCPGGGYEFLSERENEPIALQYFAAGLNVFILRYSVQEKALNDAPLIESALMVKHIREHAEEYHIDPAYVFITGFSAGGHCAAMCATLWNDPAVREALGIDRGEAPEGVNRPTASVLCYPVIVADDELTHLGTRNNFCGTEEPTEAPTQAPTTPNNPTENQGEDEMVVETFPEGDYIWKTSVTTLASNWNPHTYQTNDDSVPLDYTTSSLYTFIFNDELNPVEGKDPYAGYVILPEMAAEMPIDVTAEIKAAHPEFNIPATAESGYAYKIVLNDYLTWDDGTVINAESFVESFKRLLDPKLKGQIASADPNASSSSFAHLSNILLAMGDGECPYESEAAWNYVAQLIEQLDGAYTSGSSAVYKGVTNGEYVVGLTYEVGAVGYIANGAQGVRAVYPTEGVCWTPVGSAIVNGAKNVDNAKLFMDWLISDECQTIMATAEGSVLRGVRTDLFVPTDYMPSFETLNLKQEDSEYTSGNKQTILDHWNDLWNK